MKRTLLLAAVAMMTAICAQAQKIEVVDADGHGRWMPTVTASRWSAC